VLFTKYSKEQNRGPLVMATPSFVEHLSFSDCGKYFVTTIQGKSAPLVIPISRSHLQTTSFEVKMEIDEPALTIGSRKQSLLHDILSMSDKSRPSEPPERVLQTSGGLVTASEQTTVTRIVHDETGISAMRWHGQLDEGLHTESIPLTLLPSWPHTAQVLPDVIIPANKEDHIRVVLNKTTEEWNSFTGPAEQHLPAIVERDPRTLRDPKISPPALPPVDDDQVLETS
jgi:hypothetical protein